MKLKGIIRLFLLVLAFSCSREMDQPAKVRTIHYKARVGNEALTRATVDGDKHYIFEDTDRLYLEASGEDAPKLYGVLFLTAGAGTTSAWFEGDLYCAEEFEITESTSLKGTLVNADDKVHALANGRVSATVYPQEGYAPDFATAVRYYSDFTATGTYGSHEFVISQKSAFLIFSIRMSNEEVPENAPVSARLLNGDNLIWNSTVTALQAGKLSFVTAFPGGNTSLSGAKLSLSWENGAKTKDFTLSDKGLSANKYYSISRSTLPYKGFRIKATEDGTKIHFNYTGDGIQYSLDKGDSWTDYNAVADINLDAGKEICFKGLRANYKNIKNDGSPSNKPVFTADKKVFVSGNIMSLLVEDDYSESTAMPEDAFNGAFYQVQLDNDPSDPLVLPSTVNARCYKNMFRGTLLTTAPDLPATTVADACYASIFRECPNLTSARCNLRNATKEQLENAVDKWLVKSGSTTMLNNEGTLYCPESMNEVWNTLHKSGISIGAVPTTWTISTYPD